VNFKQKQTWKFAFDSPQYLSRCKEQQMSAITSSLTFENTLIETTTQPSAVKYAPYVKPVTGVYELHCVALQWQDNPGADVGAVSNCCNDTAANFKRLSNGQFTFTTHTQGIKVPFN